MNTKSIPAQMALTGGRGLWIVAEPEQSKWARKIDWYLNFQLMRAQTHRRPVASADLKEIAQKWQVSPIEIQVEPDASLMVASARLLPVVRTVLIPYTGNTQSWAKRCLEIWRDLQGPATRIFLPESLDAEGFARAWSQLAQKNTPRDGDSYGEAPLELVSDDEYGNLSAPSGIAES